MSAGTTSSDPTAESSNKGDLIESLLSGNRAFIGGALCSDPSGLCLGAKGEMDASTSGVYTSLVRLASELEQSGNDAPLITIETDSAAILVKDYDGHTVALRVPVKEPEAGHQTVGTSETSSGVDLSQTT